MYDLAEHLLSGGYGVQLVARRGSEVARKASALGCPLMQWRLRSRFGLCSILRMKRLIDACAADVIHTHQFKDTFIALFARALSMHRPRVVMTRHLVRPAKTNFLYDCLYRGMDCLVFVSELARKEFMSTSPKIDARKTVVIHNSIPRREPVAADSAALRRKYGISDSAVIVAYVGRLHPEKGVDVLLRAAAALQGEDFVLLVAGAGTREYEDELRSSVQSMRLSDKVIFTGFVDNVAGFMASTDIGVLPTVGREAFGLTVLEFMQAGKAVITTDNGAQVEFVSQGMDGILVPPSDSEALANALRCLIGDAALRERLGRAAMKKAEEELSYEVFFRRITAIYDGR